MMKRYGPVLIIVGIGLACFYLASCAQTPLTCFPKPLGASPSPSPTSK